jgi:hypothetical protein
MKSPRGTYMECINEYNHAERQDYTARGHTKDVTYRIHTLAKIQY